MKMQNAEMEFVAFDNQDVITTSGGPNRNSYVIPGHLGVPNGESNGVPHWDDILIDGSHSLQLWSTESEGAHNLDKRKYEQAWQLIPHWDSAIDDVYGSRIYAEQTNDPLGDEITTWQGILDWLKAFPQ